MKYPKVSVIILNFNGVKDTIECIESLKKITYPNYEIIVVDNKSAGDDVNILKERFSNIHVIANDKNYGFAEGNNIGVRYAMEHSNPKYVFILSNDTVVAKDFLEELVKVAESDDSISAVCPLPYFYNDPETPFPLYTKKSLWTAGYVEHSLLWTGGYAKSSLWRGEKPEATVEVRTTNNYIECAYTEFALLVKTEVIKKVGLYDSRFFFGAEGHDWWYRNKKAGYKMVCSLKSKVGHKRGSATSSKFPEVRMYHNICGQLLLEKKYGNFFQFTFFILYYLIVKFGYLCKTIIIGEYCNTGRTKSYLLKRLIRGIIDGLLINKK
ncbi:MAG: glycosyltransferase family 2 protein [Thermoplasmatales archaeon]|nr:glycosyltransferase family 2 protein [Thermoplasmatales archaeon]